MKKYFLIVVLVLATILRLYKISSYPAGLNADEAALGYNAYSLLTTGRDEHGHPWPINLESFGDFKPALYAYILIPFIKLFGLTEFAVRLPSAIFGVLAVLFIYLFTKETCPSGRRVENLKPQNYLGIPEITALFLAISPWHLHFSRGAWETNVATTFLLIGVWSFIKWTKDHKFMWLGICGLGFVASMYTYQSTRLITPLLGLGLIAIYFKTLRQYPRQILFSCLLLLLLLFPLGYSLVASDVSSRFSGVGFLSDLGPFNRVNEFRGQHNPPQSIFSRVFHNRPVIYSIRFIQNYLSHFNPDFLFISGDVIERNRVPETGLLYLTDFIFLFLGIKYLLNISHSSPHIKVIWLWLLVAPLASALTFQTPHALRAQNLVIPLVIIVSVGIYSLSSYLKPMILLIAIAYLWQFSRYLHQYYIHYPQEYPTAWEYGFKQLVAYTESVKDKYDRILVTDKYDQPYILFLFYSQYPPQDFQGRHQLSFRDKFNFSTVRDYDKYHFQSTAWDKVRDQHSSLIVAAPEDIPQVGVNIVKTINFPSSAPAFKIVSN